MNRPIFPPLPQFSVPDLNAQGDIGITDMADAFGVTLRTLRFYEEKGLLTPRRDGRNRLYSAADRRLMAIINACRDVGIAIIDIKAMLDELSVATGEEDANGVLSRYIKQRVGEIDDLTASMASQRASASAMLTALGSDPLPVQRKSK